MGMFLDVTNSQAFCITFLLWGNPMITNEFPSQKVSNVELWYFYCYQAVEQTVNQMMISNAMMLMWCYCKWHRIYSRAYSRWAPSQWETPLLCNICHWLGQAWNQPCTVSYNTTAVRYFTHCVSPLVLFGIEWLEFCREVDNKHWRASTELD